jgi:mono/diheme cytochrome c family protein
MRLSWPLPFLLIGCAAPVDDAQVDAVLALTGDATVGEQVYTDNCVDCHEEDGEGMKAASLPEEIPGNPDEDIVRNILAGPWIMPNFVKKLDDQQVADVLAYLRATWGEWDGTTEE